MKKLLSILSICLVFISCSPDRVHFDEITQKGEISYFEGKPFTGVAFDTHSNEQLRYEGTFKDGKEDGLSKAWYENGQLYAKSNLKDGKRNGLRKFWHSNGQLKSEVNWKDGELDGLSKEWYEDGRLEYEENYKDGVKQ